MLKWLFGSRDEVDPHLVDMGLRLQREIVSRVEFEGRAFRAERELVIWRDAAESSRLIIERMTTELEDAAARGDKGAEAFIAEYTKPVRWDFGVHRMRVSK